MTQSLTTAKVLLVEDDERLLESMRLALEAEVGEVRACADCRSAKNALEGWTPDLVVLDVALPDGDAFDVLAGTARGRARPTVVAISGAATPAQSFRLARLGVHTFLSKPFGLDELLETLTKALREPIDVQPVLRDAVGKRPLREMEHEVRATMLDEALARSDGKRSAAARLLEVSRQLLRHMVRNGRG